MHGEIDFWVLLVTQQIYTVTEYANGLLSFNSLVSRDAMLLQLNCRVLCWLNCQHQCKGNGRVYAGVHIDILLSIRSL